MNEQLILKNRLREIRSEQNLSQLQLAKLVGTSRNTISSIETGQFNPTAKLALILCIALNKKFEEIFYFDWRLNMWNWAVPRSVTAQFKWEQIGTFAKKKVAAIKKGHLLKFLLENILKVQILNWTLKHNTSIIQYYYVLYNENLLYFCCSIQL